jgi:transcriptional regulator with XRE-family HTH domain
LGAGILVERDTTTFDRAGRPRDHRGLYLPEAAPPLSGESMTGDQLRSERGRVGITGRQVAEKLGTSPTWIVTLEKRGPKTISRHTSARLRALFAELATADPDRLARDAVLSAVVAQPGISRLRLGQQVGRTKAAARATLFLLGSNAIVEHDACGRAGPHKGLYRPQDIQPSRPAEPGELRRLRLARGWTSIELASILGIPAQRITKWERGDRHCPPLWAGRVRAALAEEAGATPSASLLG